MCNFAVVNPSEGQQDVPDNEKKELRGFRTLPMMKRSDLYYSSMTNLPKNIIAKLKNENQGECFLIPSDK